MADQNYQIRVTTSADITGLTRAKAAQDALNISVKKGAEVETNGPGTQALNAQRAKIDALFEQYKKTKQAAVEVDESTERTASGGVSSLTVGLGGLGIAAIGVVTALRSVIDSNPKVSQSLTDLKDAGFAVLKDAIEGVIGTGDGLKSYFDNMTVSLGGQTAAMKQALAAIDDYIARAQPVQDAAGKMTAAIDAQAQAEKTRQREANQQQSIEGLALDQQAADAEARAAARDADVKRSRMSPEDQKAEIEQNQKAKEDELRAIEAQRAALPRLRQEQEAMAAADNQAAAEALLREQEARVGRANDLSLARRERMDAKAADDQFNTPFGRTPQAAAELPGYAGPEGGPEATAERLRKAREKEALARENFGPGMLDPKAEEEALKSARKNAEEAKRNADEARDQIQYEQERDERGRNVRGTRDSATAQVLNSMQSAGTETAQVLNEFGQAFIQAQASQAAAMKSVINGVQSTSQGAAQMAAQALRASRVKMNELRLPQYRINGGI